MENNENSIILILLLLASGASFWFLYNNFSLKFMIYNYKKNIIIKNHSLSETSDIVKKKTQVFNWFNNHIHDNIVKSEADNEVINNLYHLISIQDPLLDRRVIDMTFQFFYKNQIQFDFDLFFFMIYHLRTQKGVNSFLDIYDGKGPEFYLSWLTQVFKEICFLNTHYFKLFADLKFSDYHFYNHNFNILFKSYSYHISKYKSEFFIPKNHIEEAINFSTPVTKLDGCVCNTEAICNNCGVEISLNEKDQWAFDILNNKFDHIWTIVQNNESKTFCFKYSSYLDMFQKRIDFIESIRDFSGFEKSRALEFEYVTSFNNCFDLYLGLNLKNFYMLRESNYFNIFNDHLYLNKIFKYSSNVSDDLVNIKYVLFPKNPLVDDIENITLDDWIRFSEVHRVAISADHLSYLWDSFLELKNNQRLLVKIKSLLIKEDDVDKLKIWDYLMIENNKEIRIQLWKILLKDQENFTDYTLYFKNNNWYWTDHDEGKIFLNSINKKNVFTDEGFIDLGLIDISDNVLNNNNINIFYNIIENIIHLSLNFILVIYFLVIWFLILSSWYYILNIYYNIYFHYYKYKLYDYINTILNFFKKI